MRVRVCVCVCVCVGGWVGVWVCVCVCVVLVEKKTAWSWNVDEKKNQCNIIISNFFIHFPKNILYIFLIAILLFSAQEKIRLEDESKKVQFLFTSRTPWIRVCFYISAVALILLIIFHIAISIVNRLKKWQIWMDRLAMTVYKMLFNVFRWCAAIRKLENTLDCVWKKGMFTGWNLTFQSTEWWLNGGGTAKDGDGKGGFQSHFSHHSVTIQSTEWQAHFSDLSVSLFFEK